MECTQRIECTQQLNGPQQEKNCPEQIGFLGINGTKYPVRKGPNKIGRDPQTCNIILNLNSVSRQHAVINILNSKEYMIMDLDSANKTKLLDKTLLPYIPHPLRNGDIVQFGQIFGVFQLLEEDNDLALTQALDIPDTPVINRYVSKVDTFPSTVIPESPDVSDRDESFIVPSQPKKSNEFKSNFIKRSAKTLTIQSIGTKKIDNIYWNSSKKSVSIDVDLDDSSGSSNSHTSLKSEDEQVNLDIHEMETQIPYLPTENEESGYIHTANTQLSTKGLLSPNVVSTQKNDGLSKIHNQLEMKLDLFIENKENNNSIYNSDKKQVAGNRKDKEKDPHSNVKDPIGETSNAKRNVSNEEILYHEVDNEVQSFEVELQSQPMLLPNRKETTTETKTSNDYEDFDMLPTQKIDTNQGYVCNIKENIISDTKLNVSNEEILFNEVDMEPFEVELQSQPILLLNKMETPTRETMSSNDYENFDILPTQIILTKQDNVNSYKESITEYYQEKNKTLNTSAKLEVDDDSTDCEDDIMDTKTNNVNVSDKVKPDDDSTDCEDDIIHCKLDATKSTEIQISSSKDLATHITPEHTHNKTESSNVNTSSHVELEDMLTQVIEEVHIQNDLHNSTKESSFEDLPTQVLEAETPKKAVDGSEILQEKSPFKVPMQSIKMPKRKETTNISVNPVKENPMNCKEDDDHFYVATQDIFDDLCSQREGSSEKNLPSKKVNVCEININITKPPKGEKSELDSNNKHFLSSKLVKSNKDINVFKRHVNLSNRSIDNIVDNNEENVTNMKKTLSDSSDIESTPKKLHTLTFMETELPDSQEIKKNVTLHSRTFVTESSSDSEPNNSEEQSTPILFRKHKKVKNTKIDLTKKFEVENLPTRTITRVRKPTAKVQSNSEIKNAFKNILTSKIFKEQEEIIDKDILEENISRLKNKSRSKEDIVDGKKTNRKDVTNRDQTTEQDKTKLVELDKSHNELSKKDKVSEQSIDSHKVRESKSGTRRRTNEKQSKMEISENIDCTKDNTKNQITKKDIRSHRSSRGKQKPDNKNETKSTDMVKEADKKNKSKRSHEQMRDESPAKEIRRSKRQRKAKKDVEATVENVKYTRSKTKEDKDVKDERQSISRESTVYKISDESGIDSPKRSSNYKKFSTEYTITLNDITSKSTTRTDCKSTRPASRNIKKHKVLFTAFPSEEVKHKLEKLGAVVVTDVTSCTVVLTLQIKRTFKLLCAVGLGRPIVGANWVQACVDTNMIVDPWLYLIKDEATEKRFQFNLERTLTGKRGFLKGYNISSTPNVMPNATEMKLIVESSGGTWKEGGAKWICISSTADKSLWSTLKRRGAVIVSTELILGGVLRQKLHIEQNLLA